MTPEQKQARVSYIFQRLKAAKWLKVMQSTKYGNVYRNALRMRKLANMVSVPPPLYAQSLVALELGGCISE